MFNTFTTLAASWPGRDRLLHTSPGSVQIRWVPGHTKVPGNEAADLAAKEGAIMPPPNSVKLSYASLKR
jgi:ribonuclease HI